MVHELYQDSKYNIFNFTYWRKFATELEQEPIICFTILLRGIVGNYGRRVFLGQVWCHSLKRHPPCFACRPVFGLVKMGGADWCGKLLKLCLSIDCSSASLPCSEVMWKMCTMFYHFITAKINSHIIKTTSIVWSQLAKISLKPARKWWYLFLRKFHLVRWFFTSRTEPARSLDKNCCNESCVYLFVTC